MKNNNVLIIAFLCVCSLFSVKATEYIPVTTKNTCLLLKVNDKNRLEQTYFGASIKNGKEMESVDLDTYAAYSTFGTNHVFEAALRAIQADGNTSTELGYISSSVKNISDNIIQTTIELKDEYYDLFVTIHYKAYL